MATRRCPKKKSADKVTLHVSVPVSLHDQLILSAKAADRTVSAQVRQLLGKALGAKL